VHDATALRGKINNTYWAELVGKGPEAEPQIAALLSLPKSALQEINREQAQTQKLAGQLGQTAANQLYGGQVASAKVDVQNLKNRLHNDNVHIANEVTAMKNYLGNKLDRFADRPVLVLADGKVIARVVNTENNKGKARG
jgi:hypothetical protein